MAKKLKVILKANDNKILDDLQDIEKMDIRDVTILNNARVGRYKFFSYDPNEKKVKHVSAILKGKRKISPRKVQELLAPFKEDEDYYVARAIEYLIDLSPRCFWIEVSKGKDIVTRHGRGCSRKYELDISDFEAHHAYKQKGEEDKPYNEELGLYKTIKDKDSRMEFIYYYKDEQLLKDQIIEKLREKSLKVNNPFVHLLKNNYEK
jgi:hypothetical protein